MMREGFSRRRVCATSFRRIGAIVLRQYYLARGSVARVLPLFSWIAIDVVLWGFITRYLNQVSAAGFDFVPSLLGAVLLWDFFGRVMYGVTTAFLEDVWSRSFLNLFATPLAISEYVAGLILSSIMTSTIGLFFMLALASAVFGLSFVPYGLPLVPVLLVLFMFGIAMGVLASALVLRFGPAAEWFVWPMPALISPFVGVFYPASTLPPWMQAISHALPPSYVFEALRAMIFGRPLSLLGLLASVALAVAYVALACWAFTSVYRRAVRTGLIARYSAETVN
jgi:ABC-2 type transport system permease protein